jgi:hypothetical protein
VLNTVACVPEKLYPLSNPPAGAKIKRHERFRSKSQGPGTQVIREMP